MIEDKLIKEIVSTYGLPSKLEEKIIGKASIGINEFEISGFDNVYRYIAYLIEQFQVPFEERVALRLDKLVTSDSRTTYHELIGDKDTQVDELTQNQFKISVKENLNLLKGRIDKVNWGLLQQLVNSVDGFGLDIPSEEVLNSIPQIQEGLESLADKYERNGKIVIPPRPIVDVRFTPELVIKFGYRKYNNNPLAFFNAHKEVYGRMSRSELYRFDEGLYNALLSYKQIDEAIPHKKHRSFNGNPLAFYIDHLEVYKHLSRGQLERFDSGLYESLRKANQLQYVIPEVKHRTYNGNPLAFFERHIDAYRKMSRWELEQVDAGLCHALRKANQIQIAIPELKPHPEGKGGAGIPLSQEQINQVVALYDESKGLAYRSAKKLQHDMATIIKYWRAAGLEPLGEPLKSLSQEEIAKIIHAHQQYNKNASEAARNMGYGLHTILKYWRNENLKIRRPLEKDGFSQSQIDEIVNAYTTYNGNASKAARVLSYHHQTIRKYWKAAGLKPQGKAEPKMTKIKHN